MSEFIVVYFESFKRYVKFESFDNFSKAVEFGNTLKKKGKDVVIVKKTSKFNDKKKEVEDFYEIQKFGYYKVYNFINKILMLLF